MYEYFFKVMGAVLAAIITFTAQPPDFINNTLLLRARLNDPVTEETLQLVDKGFTFGIDYSYTLIVNSSRVYKRKVNHRLWYHNGYYLDSNAVKRNKIQQCMGSVEAILDSIGFVEGDRMIVYLKAEIQPDDEFEKSTGLKTSILWNYIKPYFKQEYIFKNKKFQTTEKQ